MGKLEIACFNSESALIAQQGGADRVELCDNIKEGGTTPDFEITREIREQITIPLYVMIRPRGGNFVYSEEEFQMMKKEIQQFKTLGVNGFVFGILNHDRTINTKQNSELVAMAKPLPCTFHRAFDAVTDILLSLENVIQCGFSTILTSGTMPNVVEGITVLQQLVEKANNRITIMPGGGLRSTNINLIQKQTNAGFYHSSAITDGSETANIDEVKMLKSNLL
ncbi:copper homeostasis protein [Flavobacterium cauense R2A-7]|uniref:PF03932 family protein CutC n=1 Tax=Flavobacterium cauense R2A-7 TaxID=1341154 RepID=A0A562LS75_9FLAO|nr:copper homeostasis protein CutC [Flavobacterium cauense]KGO80143.1 copper homeostasis protein [Flavobacterium cauense R2A-7]TWI10452.1 copper homeostasis protein [Flavobacterium cauense R2A-7]